MPRQARKKSESGIYHIILRGINQQIIFKDDEDYAKFTDALLKYKEVCGYKIYAYCLMDNHIHLLIKEEQENMELIIKRIAGSYVYWYNWKYYRKGHLFQDRYKSEPVDDEAYFLTVLRYIHQNPCKANMAGSVGEYKYSSYNDYINESGIADTDFVNSIMEKEEFIEFNNIVNNDKCIDIENQQFRMNDNDAFRLANKILNCKDVSDIQQYPIQKQKECIMKLKQHGISIRQISRITGISKRLAEETKQA